MYKYISLSLYIYIDSFSSFVHLAQILEEWQLVDSPHLAPSTNPISTDVMPELSLSGEDDGFADEGDWALLVL